MLQTYHIHNINIENEYSISIGKPKCHLKHEWTTLNSMLILTKPLLKI